MKKKIFQILCLLFSTNVAIVAQNAIPWYNPNSKIVDKELFLDKAGDCEIIKEGYDKKLGADIIEMAPRPFFLHTLEEFKQWMDDRFLIECSAGLYKANKSTFIIFDLVINSQNAKTSYGKLEFKAKLKCYLDNGEYLYLENVERSKGKVNKSKNYTYYRPVFALENYEIRSLKKHKITRIGLIWEEGYQEYDIQNMDLIQNQLECLTD